jgi:hypothetical protein
MAKEVNCIMLLYILLIGITSNSSWIIIYSSYNFDLESPSKAEGFGREYMQIMLMNYVTI